MTWENPDFITEADLGIAYRKAKADLFYERTSPYLQALSDYEENLAENLSQLYEQLQSGNLKWIAPLLKDAWTVIPKKIPAIDKQNSNNIEGHCFCSDPAEQWRTWIEKADVKSEAQFRMVGKLPVDFHIISVLWIMKVGHLYDAILGEEAYGSRLRRYHTDNPKKPGELNPMSLGTFKPYLSRYKQWRERGLAAMEQGIENSNRVAAVTADLRLFYHSLCPRFLLKKQYLSKMNLKLTVDQTRFTYELIQAIKYWAQYTPLHKDNPKQGLPVGFSASQLIANVALAELDRVILKEVQPLYYGRYVDDIILVLNDSQSFKSAEDIWSYLKKRSKNLLSFEKTDEGRAIRFSTKYLKGSDLKFIGNKQKTFLLQGESGKVLVDSIRRQINEQGSEWRRLPELEEGDRIATSLIMASGDDGKAVDSLRKTDELSIRRAGFAICLRDFEAFEQDLEPSSWASQRKIFFATVCTHFLSLPKLFNFAAFIPRLLALAVSCRDYQAAEQLLDSINNRIKQIEKDCDPVFAGNRKAKGSPLEDWYENLNLSLYESFVSALSPQHQNDNQEIQKILEWFQRAGEVNSIFEKAKQWCTQDLMRRPYRMRYMPYVRVEECWKDSNLKQGIEILSKDLFTELPWHEVFDFTEQANKKFKTPYPPFPMAMVFPTRPFSVGELYMLQFGMKKTTNNALKKIHKWTWCFRGFSGEEGRPLWHKSHKDTLVIANQSPAGKIRVALGCLETKDKSWKAAANNEPEPDSSRYRRIFHLVNSAIASKKRPHYLLLPELSIPARWFSRMAMKLSQCGISVIAGVDYLHHPGRKLVANQAWVSLCSNFLGFPQSIIYRQDKSQLAQQEENEILRIAGVRHKTLSSGRKAKPIIIHGDFHFAILICSELTNIKYRARLRGKVDAVLIPEWNKDAKTFAALVESSAQDIHTYIIQCNDRKYGDSRIRAPYKEDWQRDIVRVKGGIEDFLVIGEIDIKALRIFQADYRSPLEGPFKPIPDGFKLFPLRKPAMKYEEKKKNE